MEIRTDLAYTKSHEWVLIEGETATIGITDYAQDQLGDIVFINLPEEGDQVEEDTVFADVESVKAVSDIYSPVSGTVGEVNEELMDSPEKINESAYDAWFVRIDGVTEHGEFMSAEEYEAYIESEQE